MSTPAAETKRRVFKLPTQHGVWTRLSYLGERLGWDWLTYNPGVFRSFQIAAHRNAGPLAEAVKAEFPWARSIVDVGCGPGIFAAAFKQRGMEVVGFEYSPRGRRLAIQEGIDARPFDVGKSDRAELEDRRYDLVLSTEVAEHVPPALADAFVRFVASCSDTIIFTAAQPGPWRGNGHVNEQPREYWIEKFAALGYTCDAARTQRIASAQERAGSSWYMHQNLSIFTKPTTVTVRPAASRTIANGNV